MGAEDHHEMPPLCAETAAAPRGSSKIRKTGMAILSRAAFGLLLVATGAEAFTGVGVAPLRTHTAGSVCAAPKGLKLAPSRATANLRVAAAAKITAAKMAVSTEEKGSFPSEEYRMFFKDDGKTVSPWHGIDTWADKDKGIVNAVITRNMLIQEKTFTNVRMPHADIAENAHGLRHADRTLETESERANGGLRERGRERERDTHAHHGHIHTPTNTHR